MVNIRKYKKEDYEYLYKICRETANPNYAGNEKRMKLVTVSWLDYFTTYKSDLINVAVDDSDHPVGYILCSDDFKHYKKTMRKVFYPIMNKIDIKESIFYELYLASFVLLKGNTTHLHIDILDEYQHQGIGKRLVNTLIDDLKSKNMHSLSISGVSVGTPGYNFYNKMGFNIINKLGKNTVYFNMKF